MRFLRDHDHGDPLSADPINALGRFAERWTDAEHEFVDGKLDRRRQELVSRVDRFLDRLVEHTAPHGNGLLSVGMQDFETRPEMFSLVQEINELATNVFEAHQRLIRHARRKGVG
jgi:hypothetical protein